MYRQVHPRANISVECNTSKVPADGKYYVIKNGVIIKIFRSFKEADQCYQQFIKELNLPPLAKNKSDNSSEQILEESQSRIANKQVFGSSFGSRSKKSGRFH